MHFVGLDLAWGAVNRTGIAVVDDRGRLEVLQTRIADGDIEALIALYSDDEILAAIDAPLLVTNPSGRRPAEAHLDQQFRSFQAGPYPAFKNHPSGMFNPPRGWTLCQRLGLDIDPRSQARHRAIEVYPHPATVVLFQLSCTLKYKSGRGSTSEERFMDRKSEMVKLMRLIEGLINSSPPLIVSDSELWVDLRCVVNDATKPAQLNWAEDQIDAVLCAYIAMRWAYNPASATLFGDYPKNGYIVTPTLPAGLVADCKRSSTGPTPPGETLAVPDGPISESTAELATSQPLCPCGCGQAVARIGRFVPGHDAIALHQRIKKQWGSTLKFIEWFDQNF